MLTLYKHRYRPVREKPKFKARKLIERAVRAGAKRLDQEYPGWAKRVKLTELEFKSSCNCVYGQLDRSYERQGVVMPSTVIIDQDGNHNADENYGYVIPDHAIDAANIYGSLGPSAEERNDLWNYQENCWRDAIRKRRGLAVWQ